MPTSAHTLSYSLAFKVFSRGLHPTPSHRSNLTTPAEHLRESRASFSLMLAHLGALGRHVGPLGRHLVPLARHFVANISKQLQKNTSLEPTSSKTAPKMPQTYLPSLPKVEKTYKNIGFSMCSLSHPSPKILEKCSQNCPRSSQVELKLSILALSCSILALSWPLFAPSWPI